MQLPLISLIISTPSRFIYKEIIMNIKRYEHKSDGADRYAMGLTPTEIRVICKALMEYTGAKNISFDTRMIAGDMARQITEKEKSCLIRL